MGYGKKTRAYYGIFDLISDDPPIQILHIMSRRGSFIRSMCPTSSLRYPLELISVPAGASTSVAIKSISAPLTTFLAISGLVVGMMDEMVMWYSAPRAMFAWPGRHSPHQKLPSTIILTSMGPLASIYFNL